MRRHAPNPVGASVDVGFLDTIGTIGEDRPQERPLTSMTEAKLLVMSTLKREAGG